MRILAINSYWGIRRMISNTGKYSGQSQSLLNFKMSSSRQKQLVSEFRIEIGTALVVAPLENDFILSGMLIQ